MTFRPAMKLTVYFAAWCLTAGAAFAQPTMNAPVVVGANVTFSWSAVPGATSYDVQAGVAPGVYLYTFNVGNVTSVPVAAPAVGAYYVRVISQPGNLVSNEVVAVVTSLVDLPAAPVNFQAFRNGDGVLLSWAPGSGGGPATGYRLRAGTTPGGAQLGVIPTGTAGLAVGGVPANTYYLAVSSVNSGGASGESAEVTLVMPPGGACDAPPAPGLSAVAWGQFLTTSWSGVPGAASYLFSYNGPGFNGQIAFGAGTTRFLYPTLPLGLWSFGVQAVFSCGQAGAVGQSNLTVDNSTLRLEPRAADPPAPTPPNYIPLPNRQSVVNAVAAQYGSDLRNSCTEHGGTNRFLFRVVERLRQEDKRWGLNWKRNNVGDMSQDVITYNFGPLGDEGSRQVHVVDIIGSHCGSNPSPAWINQTELFSTGATWTLIPYIQAGYTP